MKLAHIPRSPNSKTKIINLNDLKDQDGNDIELPPDPKNNLVFDPRPNDSKKKFDIEIQDSARLVVTRTDSDEGWRWDYLYFRVYDRTKEDVPAAFDSSVAYDYWGLNRERAPRDTIVAKVHHTVTAIKYYAFGLCDKMTTCDMSNARMEEIHAGAFYDCRSLRSILFSRNHLKKIGPGAFQHCKAIDVLVLPSTVTHIEGDSEGAVFDSCTNMRILKLPDAIDFKNVCRHIVFRCLQLEYRNIATYESFPEQWLKDRYDPYPLHKVCYNAYVTIEEIQQCIQTHPHAAYLSDEFNMTALHMITIMACTSNLRVQTETHNLNQNRDEDQGATHLLGGMGHITACFDANMSAAFAPDDRNKTPLDYLLESCDGLDVHTALVTLLCLHRSASSVYGSSSFSRHHTACSTSPLLFKRRRYH